MKYMKLVLVALLVFAVAAMAFGCPAPEAPPAGSSTTTTTGSGSGSGGGGGTGQQPGGGGVEDNSPGKLYFSPINAKDCEVIGFSGKFADGIVTIPETYTDGGRTYTVKRIAAGAFKNCTSMKSIVIDDAITAIGFGAFEGCTSLTSITLPYVGSGTGTATGVELGSYFGYIFGAVSFAENASVVPASLKSVTLSDACTKIADFAFDSCASITEINLGANIESIGRYAFAGTGITEASIPATVTSVGIGAYARCELASISLPFVGADATAEVGYIGHLFGASSYLQNPAFVPATLTEVTVLDGCTALGTGAFYGCAALTTPNLPESVVSIGRAAFEGTAYFAAKNDNAPVYIGKVFYTYKGNVPSSFTVADGTVSIAAGAFAGMDITSVSIPVSVTHIGLGAFENTKLTSITLSFIGESADNEKYNYFGYIFGDAKLADNGNSVPATLKTVVLNASCKTVASRAFYGCTTIESVEIGASVDAIAKDAFFACSSLKTITVNSANEGFKIAGGLLYNKAGTDLVAVPNAITGEITLLDITAIGEGQFANCTGITKVNLPASLRSIAKDAFKGATNVTFSAFPSDLSYVGYAAFDGTAWYNTQTNGLIKTGKVLYRVKGAMENVTVPAGIVYITEGAFEETGAKTVVLSNTVTSVGFGIFRGCNAITSLTLPFVGQNLNATANTLLGYMFGAETLAATAEAIPATLTTVTILDGCTDIGANAFYGCVNLATINFPASITYVAGNAFDTTPYLANAAQGTDPFFYIGKILYRFFPPADAAANDAIYDVVVRPGTVMIADNAFAGTLVRTVTMPDSTVTIGANAFANCTKLTATRVSSDLTTLGKGAFSGCTSLFKIWIPSSLKVISESAFEGCTGLKEIYMCRGVEKIDVNAFNGCRTVRFLVYIVEDPDTDNSWLEIGFENQGATNFNSNIMLDTPANYPEEDFNPPYPED